MKAVMGGAMDKLEQRVTELLARADKMKEYIKAREFVNARIEAGVLEILCVGTILYMNKLADKD